MYNICVTGRPILNISVEYLDIGWRFKYMKNLRIKTYSSNVMKKNFNIIY